LQMKLADLPGAVPQSSSATTDAGAVPAADSAPDVAADPAEAPADAAPATTEEGA